MFIARLVERIRAEYTAMPALKLTREQACRLWGVNHDTCAQALEVLLAEGFLHQTGTGKYVALPRPSGVGVAASREPVSATVSIRCPHCAKLHVVEPTQAVRGGHLPETVRCAGCQRIISLAKLRA